MCEYELQRVPFTSSRNRGEVPLALSPPPRTHEKSGAKGIRGIIFDKSFANSVSIARYVQNTVNVVEKCVFCDCIVAGSVYGTRAVPYPKYYQYVQPDLKSSFIALRIVSVRPLLESVRFGYRYRGKH